MSNRENLPSYIASKSIAKPRRDSGNDISIELNALRSYRTWRIGEKIFPKIPISSNYQRNSFTSLKNSPKGNPSSSMGFPIEKNKNPRVSEGFEDKSFFVSHTETL